MRDTKEINKNGNKTIKLIIISILIIVLISLIGFAYARYRTMLNGSTSAEVAKWSFNYKILETAQREEVTNFAVTRTDENTDVQDLTLAPGTSGQFIIEINAAGTETLIEYNINIEMQNKPTNLKFYYDSSKTEEIELEDDCLVINRIYVFNR